MWPLTLLTPPRCREAAVVCVADKMSSATETLFERQCMIPAAQTSGRNCLFGPGAARSDPSERPPDRLTWPAGRLFASLGRGIWMDISQIKNKLSKNNKKHLKNDMHCGMLLPYRKED